jgi:hypothetical protein
MPFSKKNLKIYDDDPEWGLLMDAWAVQRKELHK